MNANPVMITIYAAINDEWPELLTTFTTAGRPTAVNREMAKVLRGMAEVFDATADQQV